MMTQGRFGIGMALLLFVAMVGCDSEDRSPLDAHHELDDAYATADADAAEDVASVARGPASLHELLLGPYQVLISAVEVADDGSVWLLGRTYNDDVDGGLVDYSTRTAIAARIPSEGKGEAWAHWIPDHLGGYGTIPVTWQLAQGLTVLPSGVAVAAGLWSIGGPALVALDQSGEVIWRRNFQSPPDELASLGRDRVVSASSSNGIEVFSVWSAVGEGVEDVTHLHIVDPQSGELLRSSALPDADEFLAASLTVQDEELVVVASQNDGAATIWKLDLDGELNAQQRISDVFQVLGMESSAGGVFLLMQEPSGAMALERLADGSGPRWRITVAEPQTVPNLTNRSGSGDVATVGDSVFAYTRIPGGMYVCDEQSVNVSLRQFHAITGESLGDEHGQVDVRNANLGLAADDNRLVAVTSRETGGSRVSIWELSTGQGASESWCRPPDLATTIEFDLGLSGPGPFNPK